MRATLKKIIYLFITLLILPAVSWADHKADGLDAAIGHAMQPITNFVVSVVFVTVPFQGVDVPLIVLWLVAGAVFFTFYLGFINFRGFKHAIELVRGKYDDPKDPGEISHFRALATALSGTVGLGNIAGVAVAISVGGPGATFWMILAGFLGMSSKFAECTLGVKYRNEYEDGTVSGGPMRYLSKGLADLGLAGLGKFLAVFFSICCVGGAIGGGNLFQANQSYNMVVHVMGGEGSFFADKGWLFGLILATLVGAVIIGGIKEIASVAARLVPGMAIIYLLAAVTILVMSYEQIPHAFSLIINGAFSAEGVTGGVLGVMIQGFKRAAFSNEAGIGSAAIAHSAVKTHEPVTEGFVSLLEPFIDTVVICTMTALVIIITGAYTNEEGLGGVELTSRAFESGLSWFPYVLSLAVVLFAFSTMISWSYYGTQAWAYLFGHSKVVDLSFKLIFCSVVVLGCTMDLGPVIDFSDSMIFAMSLANIAGLYLLAPVVKRELKDYWGRLKSGQIETT